MMNDDEHADWMGPEDPMENPEDPLPEAYWAAREAVGRIVPEGLTLRNGTSFWSGSRPMPTTRSSPSCTTSTATSDTKPMT